MDRLDDLEAQTIFILREAVNRLTPLGMLWSIGKDSNVLLWLARKAFFGRVPFPVIQLDTGNELPEVYAFRDRIIGNGAQLSSTRPARRWRRPIRRCRRNRAPRRARRWA